MSEINDTEEIHEGNFPINLKFIKQHQRKHPRLFSKYKEGAYKKGYFCGGSNIYHNPLKCDYNIIIPPILQSYVLNW